jgi:ketopantoate reductase
MPIRVNNITKISNFYNLFFKNKFIKNNILLNYLNISNFDSLKLNTKKYIIEKKIQLYANHLHQAKFFVLFQNRRNI